MDITNITIVVLIFIIIILLCYCLYLFVFLNFFKPIPTSIQIDEPVVYQEIKIIKPEVTTTSDKLDIPIVKEITFNNKVIPKPVCLYNQVYNDKARKCLCPASTQRLFNNQCREVKCNDGYVIKKSGIGRNGNYVICMNPNGESKKIAVENLDVA